MTLKRETFELEPIAKAFQAISKEISYGVWLKPSQDCAGTFRSRSRRCTAEQRRRTARQGGGLLSS